MKEYALLIFVKAPVPEAVKTRLRPELTSEEAVALYRAMAEDICEIHSGSARYDTIVYYTPVDSRTDIEQWLGEHREYRGQRGDNLGERMYNAIKEVLNSGYSGVVLIGTDCPHLTPRDIAHAFDKLGAHELVIGPSEDGGYYLIGATCAHRNLFDGIDWGGHSVFDETLKKIAESSISYAVLETTFDTDTYADVERLYGILKNSKEHMLAQRSLKTLDAIFNRREQ